MSGPLATQYANLLARLADTIKSQWAWPSPEAGFALFAFVGIRGESPLPPLDSWPPDDRLVHSPSLAAAGFAMACGFMAEESALWVQGIDRLRRRDAFPADRQSFAYRPIELLGITAGIVSRENDANITGWISSVLARTRKEHPQDGWTNGLQYAAERMVGIQGGRHPGIEECKGLDELALLQWLDDRFNLSVDKKELARKILEQSMFEPLGDIDLPRAAVIFTALQKTVRAVISSDVERNWQIGRDARDAENLVVHLCRRFHLFAEQLTQRHDERDTLKFADEYDVQDALHALLRLHFDDVRPEEVTPSVGGQSGRMDFLLKREQIVVEAKMTRKGLDQKKVGDELIIDMRRYQSHPDVRTLICFVYDPNGYCRSPAALEGDLSTTEGKIRTVVVVCPKGL